MDKEFLHIKEAKGPCQIHSWPTKGLARRLVKAMRETHPVGINACRECIERAREDLEREKSYAH